MVISFTLRLESRAGGVEAGGVAGWAAVVSEVVPAAVTCIAMADSPRGRTCVMTTTPPTVVMEEDMAGGERLKNGSFINKNKKKGN